jgi:hypothetical protein
MARGLQAGPSDYGFSTEDRIAAAAGADTGSEKDPGDAAGTEI